MAESSESVVQTNGGISSQEESVDDMWIPGEEHEFTSSVNVRKDVCWPFYKVESYRLHLVCV